MRDNQHYKDKIRKSLSINLEDKVVLYAPTFRDDGNLDYLNLDFEKLVCSLETGFGESVTLLIRLHPNAIHNSEKINFSKKIKNASFYSDMQELLIVSDVLISDYSSAITDFILLEKP
ncbi:CDP-glycerol glycerophosphotransferase family protein, partial [Streptococcus suis]